MKGLAQYTLERSKWGNRHLQKKIISPFLLFAIAGHTYYCSHSWHLGYTEPLTFNSCKMFVLSGAILPAQ